MDKGQVTGGVELTIDFCPIPTMAFSDQLQTEIEHLQAENARFIALLDVHGISWKTEDMCRDKNISTSVPRTDLSTNEKIALYSPLMTSGRI